jgi:hypothetical protein
MHKLYLAIDRVSIFSYYARSTKPNQGKKGGGIVNKARSLLDLLTRWAALFCAVLAALGILAGILAGFYLWGQRAAAYCFSGSVVGVFLADHLFRWALRPPPHHY